MNDLYISLNKKFHDEIPSSIIDSLSGIPIEWEEILFNKRAIKLLVKIYSRIQKSINGDDENLSPNPTYIFNFAKLTPLLKINIVIIGQDPYPNKKHAHGLSFSSLDSKIPGSLKNIFACLVKQKLIKKMPKKPNLTIWARRGILLLNSALTTEINVRNVHQKLWAPYTNLLIETLCLYFSEKNRNLIFMLWGNDAQEKSYIIDSYKSNDHIILEWRHPSPLAQHCLENLKFINCTNFKEANDIFKENHKLNETNIPKISWSLKKKKMIIYTDGSAYPNKHIPKAKNGYACVFTNGCLDGLVIKGSSPRFITHPLTNKKLYSTNQRAEGMAIWKTLSKCNTLTSDKWDEIEIVTDSEFWMNMLKIYIPNWEKKKLDFNEKTSLPYIAKGAWKEMIELQKKGIVKIRHIKSHRKLEDVEKNSKEECDIQNNMTADQLANDARKELEYGECIEEYPEFE